MPRDWSTEALRSEVATVLKKKFRVELLGNFVTKPFCGRPADKQVRLLAVYRKVLWQNFPKVPLGIFLKDVQLTIYKIRSTTNLTWFELRRLNFCDRNLIGSIKSVNDIIMTSLKLEQSENGGDKFKKVWHSYVKTLVRQLSGTYKAPEHLKME